MRSRRDPPNRKAVPSPITQPSCAGAYTAPAASKMRSLLMHDLGAIVRHRQIQIQIRGTEDTRRDDEQVAISIVIEVGLRERSTLAVDVDYGNRVHVFITGQLQREFILHQPLGEALNRSE